MTTQTEAERLAGYLDDCNRLDLTIPEAAAELRRLVLFNQQLMDEVAEQCRINGMSAEREDALRAEVERLNKAVADEREACAKECDDHATKDGFEGCYANACAESIRARSNT